MLIDALTLHGHLDDSNWIVFDCRHDLFDHARGAQLYAEEHVPGAYFAPVETVLSGAKRGTNGRHPLPSADAFAAFLNEHGVTPATQIVAYDDVGGQYAARLWWLARWIGLTRVAVLDGGLPKWRASGHPLTTELPPRRGGGTVMARPGSMPVADASAVRASLEREADLLVVDARAPERFRGETEPIDKMAGHIPGARNRFFKLNLTPEQTLRPAADLRPEFEALLGNAWKPEQVVHQCGSGVTACVNLLAMEHAGLRGSRLFVGSWSEWIADPTRPVARGE